MEKTTNATPSGSLLHLFAEQSGDLDKLEGKEFYDSYGNKLKLTLDKNETTKTIEFEVTDMQEDVKLGFWQRTHIYLLKNFFSNESHTNEVESRYKNNVITSRAYSQRAQLDANKKYDIKETDTSFAKMFKKPENKQKLQQLLEIKPAKYINQKQLASPFFDSRHLDLTPDNTVLVQFKVPKQQVEFYAPKSAEESEWRTSVEKLPTLNMVMSKCDVARLLIKGSLVFGKDPKDEWRIMFHEHYKITVKAENIRNATFSQVTDHNVEQATDAMGGLNTRQVRMLNQKSWGGWGQSVRTYGRGGAMDMPPLQAAQSKTVTPSLWARRDLTT